MRCEQHSRGAATAGQLAGDPDSRTETLGHMEITTGGLGGYTSDYGRS